MYSDQQHVQILVSLLRKFGVRSVVISPGARNVPLVLSFEADAFFKCYCIYDERSAGFFALGLSLTRGEPVAICCTSGTAATNYAPAIAEASAQKVPLITIVADWPAYRHGQDTDQSAAVLPVLAPLCRAAVALPGADQPWHCQRLLNDALLGALDPHAPGPVLCTVPLDGGIGTYSTETLPDVPLTRRVDSEDADAWEDLAADLRHSERTLVVCGQRAPGPPPAGLDAFVAASGCALAAEPLGNLPSAPVNLYAALGSQWRVPSRLRPDLLITFGGRVVAPLANLLAPETFRHWSIDPGGATADPFRRLDTIVRCHPGEFFSRMTKAVSAPNAGGFAADWARLATLDVPPPGEWCGLWAVHRVIARLPGHSLIHLANSSAVRLASTAHIPPGLPVYCNRGCNGIEGSLSTAMAQALATDRLTLLVIGDLSFFYEAAVLALSRCISPRLRILLVNNGGGAWLHSTIGLDRVPSLNIHIAAAHEASAERLARGTAGLVYLAARTCDDLNAALARFVSDESAPMLLEAHTEMTADAAALATYQERIRRAIQCLLKSE